MEYYHVMKCDTPINESQQTWWSRLSSQSPMQIVSIFALTTCYIQKSLKLFKLCFNILLTFLLFSKMLKVVETYGQVCQ